MATCSGTNVCECDETECPKTKNAPPAGPAHCRCWYDNAGCCWCGDPPCAVQQRLDAAEADQASPGLTAGDS